MNNIYSVYFETESKLASDITNIISNIGVDAKGGVDAISICVYDNYTSYVENIYVVDIEGSFPIFLIEPNVLKVEYSQDTNFTPINITYSDPSMFFEKYMNEKEEVIKYIGDIATSFGDYFVGFGLVVNDLWEHAEEWLIKYREYGFDYLSSIVMSDEEVLETLENFMNYKISKFMEDIEKSKIMGSALDSLVENPFANEYFDSVEAENQI
jgi:hypothetical protein